MPPKKKARLIEPMLLLRTDELPADGSRWAYQLKVDGYRAIAFTTNTKLHLRSRNNNDFSLRYPTVLKGLAKLPNETIVDGEIVAFDETGRPSFNALQNAASSRTPIVYYVFDLLMLAGRDLRAETLDHPSRATRREGPAEALRAGPIPDRSGREFARPDCLRTCPVS
jgi:bifunctional non-homologous end joining protein LigD